MILFLDLVPDQLALVLGFIALTCISDEPASAQLSSMLDPNLWNHVLIPDMLLSSLFDWVITPVLV